MHMRDVAITMAAIMVVVLYMHQAYATSIDFDHCARNADNKCMIPMPELNQANGTANPNELITVNFPQNGSPVVEGVLSHDNFTKFETAVGVARVAYSATNIPVTLNLCPLDKLELENQDGYLGQYFYNTSRVPVLNLTHYIYPDYCDIETGQNPVDHSYNVVAVPEFPMVSMIVMLLALTSAIIMRYYERI